MDKNTIILIGGGGHCKSVIDVIESADMFAISCIIDKPDLKGNLISGYEIKYQDDDIASLAKEFKNFHITVGQIKSNAIRVKLFNLVKSVGGILPVIISPKSYISKRSEIGEGSAIMHHAMINAGAIIGINTIINSKAVIEHDAKVGSHCHISTSAVVNGDCIIEDNCFIGSNAVIGHGVTIKANSIIGAGSVVLKNLESGFYAGNPATKKN